MVVSAHHFLWEIAHCKIKVTCNIDWSTPIYRDACSIPDPDTDTVVVTGGKFTLTTVARYGKQGWIEDFSSGLSTGRGKHGCTSFLSQDNERVNFNWTMLKHSKNNCRCCWSLEAGPMTIMPLPPLRCIAPLLESGGRSLVVLCQGQWLECVWWLSTTESFSLVRRSF